MESVRPHHALPPHRAVAVVLITQFHLGEVSQEEETRDTVVGLSP